jgi:RNA polymerase sigma-70 factor (ECF subfamily)
MSYEELAAQKAVPLGTIKTWIHRAIGQLQRCLNQ